MHRDMIPTLEQRNFLQCRPSVDSFFRWEAYEPLLNRSSLSMRVLRETFVAKPLLGLCACVSTIMHKHAHMHETLLFVNVIVHKHVRLNANLLFVNFLMPASMSSTRSRISS